ncbi:Gag polyprotein [Labeo rohita]|uniref:Gag polyprotein n=1 Tax=Labeo rohita TaxID=84645 RepID=A0ABQ8L2E8_LABRO|nr:Gag polyprotein [Labeo rohita]
MEDEMQELRELVAQLRTDNDRLRRERESSGSNTVPVATVTAHGPPQPVEPDLVVPERFVFVPRDRRCTKFSGKSGIGIEEWVEEAEACMRARYLSKADKAFFLFDHLEGEAREEIRYRSVDERNDPEAAGGGVFVGVFPRSDGLLERVKQKSPYAMPNFQVLLRDQFIEHVNDNSLRRELKQLVRGQPTLTLLDVRCEALRWEREGMPGVSRGRSHSLPSAYGIQYGVRGEPRENTVRSSQESELGEVKEMLRLQQEQISKLTQSIARLQAPQPRSQSPRRNQIVCRRCQKPGHFARECDGERVLTRFPSSASSQMVSGQPDSTMSSGN